MIDAVSETTRFNFKEVYEMSILEFLAYVAYINHKRLKDEQRLNDFKHKQRIV